MCTAYDYRHTELTDYTVFRQHIHEASRFVLRDDLISLSPRKSYFGILFGQAYLNAVTVSVAINGFK